MKRKFDKIPIIGLIGGIFLFLTTYFFQDYKTDFYERRSLSSSVILIILSLLYLLLNINNKNKK